MLEKPSQSNPSFSPRYRDLLLALGIATYLLILGGINQRVSGAHPLTLGGIALHYWAAGLTLALLLPATILAWQPARRSKWLAWPLSAALGLLGIQSILGAQLSQLGQPAGASTLHLGLALIIQTLVLVPVVAAFIPSGQEWLDQAGRGRRISPFTRLSLLTLIAVFVLLVSGAFVTASGAALACQDWPLCGTAFFPTSASGWIAVVHRFATLLAGGFLIGLVWRAWRSQRSRTAVLVATTAAAVLFISQALMGAVESAGNHPAYLVGLHTATAAGVWAALVIQFFLSLLQGRSAEDERQEVAAAAHRTGLAKDFLTLTKPVVVLLLLVTTYAGMVIGAKAWPSWQLTLWVLLGGFMAAGGSGAINQYIDRADDRKMQRTQARPIPAGRLTPGEGLAFGVGMALASFYLMAAFVNFLAALLTLAGIIYYVLIYSILLKKATVQNIVIGGGAGAIPPLVGWAAATGHLNVPSLFLFALVFLWTPPHFWALALVRRNDYARAGVPMLPVVRGERETRWQIFLYTIELVALTLVMPIFGLGGGVYLVAAALLGGSLLYSAWKVWRGEGNKVAWTMYRQTSMYLALIFVALMIDALL